MRQLCSFSTMPQKRLLIWNNVSRFFLLFALWCVAPGFCLKPGGQEYKQFDNLKGFETEALHIVYYPSHYIASYTLNMNLNFSAVHRTSIDEIKVSVLACEGEYWSRDEMKGELNVCQDDYSDYFSCKMSNIVLMRSIYNFEMNVQHSSNHLSYFVSMCNTSETMNVSISYSIIDGSNEVASSERFEEITFLVLVIIYGILTVLWTFHIICKRATQDTSLQQRIGLVIFSKLLTVLMYSILQVWVKAWADSKVSELFSMLFRKLHGALFCEVGLLISCGWKITKKELSKEEKLKIYNLVFLFVVSEWLSERSINNEGEVRYFRVFMSFSFLMIVYLAILGSIWLFLVENTAAIRFYILSTPPQEQTRIEILETTRDMLRTFKTSIFCFYFVEFVGVFVFGNGQTAFLMKQSSEFCLYLMICYTFRARNLSIFFHEAVENETDNPLSNSRVAVAPSNTDVDVQGENDNNNDGQNNEKVIAILNPGDQTASVVGIAGSN